MMRVALVTGSSRGIGAQCARALAKEGYAVCINCVERTDKAEALAEELKANGANAIWQQADVADALASGQLEGYGADVMVQEPPTMNNPLLHHPNAYITPHIAWASVEARARLLQATFKNIRCYLEGKPQNVVS